MEIYPENGDTVDTFIQILQRIENEVGSLNVSKFWPPPTGIAPPPGLSVKQPTPSGELPGYIPQVPRGCDSYRPATSTRPIPSVIDSYRPAIHRHSSGDSYRPPTSDVIKIKQEPREPSSLPTPPPCEPPDTKPSPCFGASIINNLKTTPAPELELRLTETLIKLGVVTTTSQQLQTQLEHTQRFLQERNRTIENANATLLRKEHEINTMKAKLQEKDQELERITKTISQKEHEVAATRSVMQKEEIVHQKTKMVVGQKDQELLMLKTVVEKQKKDLAAAKATLSQKTNDLMTARTTIEKQKQEIITVKNSMLKMEKLVGKVSFQSERKDEDIKKGDEALSKLTAERDDKANSLELKNKDFAVLKKTHEKMKLAHEELKTRLGKKDEQIGTLKEMLSVLRRDKLNAKNEAKTSPSTDEIAKLKAMLASRDQDILVKDDELDMAQAALRCARAEVDLANAKLDEERARKRRKT
ncbi:hypothetical protein EX30DRAFT_396764 [Ascodesmis nigricans]|uniref:Uncharacterized protein n=1 Tax=Ascodesmis nigricans TaxID=341454 RepID=A0A4S2MTT8_9PEZI|nr:hypothetical protein EX30DRAFT_396764 [Ascodesmis nigricans]